MGKKNPACISAFFVYTTNVFSSLLCLIFDTHAIHAAILVLYVFFFPLNIMGDVYAFSLFLFINSYLFMGNVCPFPYLSWTSLPEQDRCVLCPTLRMLRGTAERVK